MHGPLGRTSVRDLSDAAVLAVGGVAPPRVHSGPLRRIASPSVARDSCAGRSVASLLENAGRVPPQKSLQIVSQRSLISTQTKDQKMLKCLILMQAPQSCSLMDYGRI